MIYVDTSAAAKLLRQEAESNALTTFLAARIGTPLVSSALLYPELVRAVSRHCPALLPRAVALVQRMMTMPLSAQIVEQAATIGNPMLRTLDALHLATAASVATELEALVTYDTRLAGAAADLGITTTAPI